MKKIWILLSFALFFSCETAKIENESIAEQILTEPSLSEDSSHNNVFTQEIEESVFDIDTPVAEDDVVQAEEVDIAELSEETDSFFMIEEVEPMLVDEAEVVLGDGYEMIIADSEMDAVPLIDEELAEELTITEELPIEEDEVPTPVIISSDSLDEPTQIIESSGDIELVVEEISLLDTTAEDSGNNIAEEVLDELMVDATLEDNSALENPLQSTDVGAIEVEDSLPQTQETITDNIDTQIETAADVVEDSSAILPTDAFFDDSLGSQDITGVEQAQNGETLTISQDEQAETILSENELVDTVIIPSTMQDTVIIDAIAENTESETPIQITTDGSEENVLDAPVIDSENQESTVDDTVLDTIVIDENGLMLPLEPLQDTNLEETDYSLESVTQVEPPTIEELVKPIEASQKLELFEGDYIDIILPGHGWIYLGEVEETDPTVLDFYARYIDGDDTLFNFYAENNGTTMLHFYKQDIIANVYVDEYIEVTVSPVKTAVETPRTSSSSRTEELYGISSEPEVSLVGGNSETIEFEDEGSQFVPEDILDEAQTAFDEERYQDSIALLDEYTSLGVDEIDRALFMYGKNYEATSDIKNVRLSIASYEKLVESFPNSTYWDDATKRLIYLERFYVNIR